MIIGWTTSPTTAANTNRDGSGTLYKILTIDAAKQFVDTVHCTSLGSNIATEGVLLVHNGQGLGNARNVAVLAAAQLPATTAGSIDTTDKITFTLEAWLPQDYELYALVHDAQASGRHFIAFSDATYQVY